MRQTGLPNLPTTWEPLQREQEIESTGDLISISFDSRSCIAKPIDDVGTQGEGTRDQEHLRFDKYFFSFVELHR